MQKDNQTKCNDAILADIYSMSQTLHSDSETMTQQKNCCNTPSLPSFALPPGNSQVPFRFVNLKE
jgi:hypothetical protein